MLALSFWPCQHADVSPTFNSQHHCAVPWVTFDDTPDWYHLPWVLCKTILYSDVTTTSWQAKLMHWLWPATCQHNYSTVPLLLNCRRNFMLPIIQVKLIMMPPVYFCNVIFCWHAMELASDQPQNKNCATYCIFKIIYPSWKTRFRGKILK